MARGPRFAVKFRRKRAGKTNYKSRLALLKSKLPRLVVRKSNKYILGQVINYDVKGDRTVFSVSSAALKKLGWKYSCKNLPAAYLTGLLVGKKAKESKIDKAVFDHGLYTSTKESKLYSFLKGVVDAGLNVEHSDKNLPSEDRISGKHIFEYLKKPDIIKDFEELRLKIVK